MFLLKCQTLIDKVFVLLTASPTPAPKKYEYMNSATSDTKMDEKDYGVIGEWLEDGLRWIADKLLDILEPFVNWGCKIIIVSCVIIFFCSHERKYISTALKYAIIFIVFWVIRGAVG